MEKITQEYGGVVFEFECDIEKAEDGKRHRIAMSTKIISIEQPLWWSELLTNKVQARRIVEEPPV